MFCVSFRSGNKSSSRQSVDNCLSIWAGYKKTFSLISSSSIRMLGLSYFTCQMQIRGFQCFHFLNSNLHSARTIKMVKSKFRLIVIKDNWCQCPSDWKKRGNKITTIRFLFEWIITFSKLKPMRKRFECGDFNLQMLLFWWRRQQMNQNVLLIFLIAFPLRKRLAQNNDLYLWGLAINWAIYRSHKIAYREFVTGAPYRANC